MGNNKKMGTAYLTIEYGTVYSYWYLGNYEIIDFLYEPNPFLYPSNRLPGLFCSDNAVAIVDVKIVD